VKCNETCGTSGTRVLGAVSVTGWEEARPLRNLTLIVAACVLTGCATDVAMQNPRTGDTVTCRASLRGLNPWSQQDACVADHIAQGWRRANAE
jgi:hypothetical protein